MNLQPGQFWAVPGADFGRKIEWVYPNEIWWFGRHGRLFVSKRPTFEAWIRRSGAVMEGIR